MNLCKMVRRIFPPARRGSRPRKQHVNNALGNAIGERKHEMYLRLKSGAELETSVNKFLVDTTRDLKHIVEREARLALEHRASHVRRDANPSGQTVIIHEGRGIEIEPAIRHKRRDEGGP